MTAMRKPPKAGRGARVGVITPAWVNKPAHAPHRLLRWMDCPHAGERA